MAGSATQRVNRGEERGREELGKGWLIFSLEETGEL